MERGEAKSPEVKPRPTKKARQDAPTKVDDLSIKQHPRIYRTKEALHFEAGVSPGGLVPTRLVVLPSSLSSPHQIVASKNKVYHLSFNVPPYETDTGEDPTQLRTIESVQEQELCIWPIENRHRCEIQSLALKVLTDGQWLGSIDASGCALVTCLTSAQPTEAPDQSTSSSTAQSLRFFSIPPAPDTCREWGWAGIALHPSLPAIAATTQYFGRSIQLSSEGRTVRTVHSSQYPTQVAFLGLAASPNPLIAITEGSQLSLWDMRAQEKNGNVQRIRVGSELLYALACDAPKADVVAVGGMSRVVTVYDVRKWTPRGRWSNALKYEITSIHFSTRDENLCYVGALIPRPTQDKCLRTRRSELKSA